MSVPPPCPTAPLSPPALAPASVEFDPMPLSSPADIIFCYDTQPLDSVSSPPLCWFCRPKCPTSHSWIPEAGSMTFSLSVTSDHSSNKRNSVYLSPHTGLFGVYVTLPVTQHFMVRASPLQPAESWSSPAGTRRLGHTSSSPSTCSWVVPGPLSWSPTPGPQKHTSLPSWPISRVS